MMSILSWAMTKERHQRMRRIFHAAVELSAEERSIFLDSDCGSDIDLRKEVEQLLSDVEMSDFLLRPLISPDFSEDWIGLRLKDRYGVDELLTASDLTRVYRAHDERLHSRQVIIKRLNADRILDAWLHEKFQDEAAALTRIDHPGVVGVLDSGETPDGIAFLVLPFITGMTLRSALENKSISPAQGWRILQQVCSALAAAHDRGVLHRDIKPENIVLRPTGPQEEQAVLIDFGLATFTEAQRTSQMTRVVGTLSYMAPEQFSGQMSIRSDVYALGVIGRELLGKQIPQQVHAVFAKATAYDESSRYPTVREFSKDLANAFSPKSRSRPKRWIVGVGIAALVFILSIFGAIRYGADVSQSIGLKVSPPFEVIGTEETYVSEAKGIIDRPQPGQRPAISGAIGWRMYPMVHFDLTNFAGKKVVGPVTFQWKVHDNYGHITQTHDISIHTVIPPWHADSVSWKSFGPLKMPITNQDYSAAIESRRMDFVPGETASFSIPPSVIQIWIDTPSANQGFIIISSTLAGQNNVDLEMGTSRLIFYCKDERKH